MIRSLAGFRTTHAWTGWCCLLALPGIPQLAGQQAAAPARAADPAVHRMLEQLRQDYGLPGLIAARIDHGQISKIGVAGVRKVGTDLPMTIDDQIHLGSCTKAMTATLLAILVQEGRISWNTTVGEVLSAFRAEMNPRYGQVTLRQLLSHRGGLPVHDERIFRTDTRLSPTQQRQDLFRQLLADEPVYEPGSRYEYSNLGYLLAGLMAETVTGQAWEELMRQRLFQPLQMTSAGFGPPGIRGQVDQPWGHRRKPVVGSAGGAGGQSTRPRSCRQSPLQCGRLGSLPGVPAETSASAAAVARIAAGRPADSG